MTRDCFPPLAMTVYAVIARSGATKRSRADEPGGLREELFSGLGILDKDRADWAVLRRLQDLFDSVTRGIDGFRLPVLVEAKYVGGEGLAHRIPDASRVVDPD